MSKNPWPFRLTKPCAHCPFRLDVPGFLARDRARDIADSLLAGEGFTCHETNDYDAETGEGVVTPRSNQCAGSMIVLRRMGRENQIMQVGERLGRFDPARLAQPDHVCADLDAFVDHHDD